MFYIVVKLLINYIIIFILFATALGATACVGGFGVLESWSRVLEACSIGVLESWSLGDLESCNLEVLESWNLGVLEYWSLRVLESWVFGSFRFRSF